MVIPVWVLCLLLNVSSAIYRDCAKDEDLVSRFQPVRTQKSLSVATFSNGLNRSNRGTEEFNSTSCKPIPLTKEASGQLLITLFKLSFIQQDLSRRMPMSMTKQSLAYLLEHNDVPPELVEILVNNNGAYTSSVQYDTDGITPAQLRMANSMVVRCGRLTTRQIYS